MLQEEIKAFLHLSPNRLWDRPCEEKGTDKGLIKTKGKLRLKTQNVVRFFNFAFQRCSLTYIFIQSVRWFFCFVFFFKSSLRI